MLGRFQSLDILTPQNLLDIHSLKDLKNRTDCQRNPKKQKKPPQLELLYLSIQEESDPT